MKDIIFRILITSTLVFVYCVIWIALEYYIEGKVTDSLVDNIMMLLLIPIFWGYSEKVCNRNN